MADYRNTSGIELEDGPYGATVTIEDSSRVDPWIVRQAQRARRRVYRAACRVQPPRPTRVRRLTRGRDPDVRDRRRHRSDAATTRKGMTP